MPSPPTSISSTAKDQIDTLLREAVENTDVPPFYLAAFTADSTLYSQAFGSGKDGKLYDEHTVLRIFSMTKLITSVSPSPSSEASA